ncbi:Transmembrane amino acid transporter family protein [Klebsormidium nitens]|uniref:Transmembrane amino acid transporter family protein n=1 Tax=Klebsormidium nitens TaxID=105231 RepID=A0A1Y1IEI1_KLENI|nr:Transmembrane amino acid transporter family protein [Klebsormidium nitens]|eukprot:GAQ87117.1 Transmembrane amino acid transporter family protein [Klebsormidium nitens]
MVIKPLQGWITTPLTATQMGLLLSSLSMVGLGLVNAFACTVMLQAAEEFGTPESYHDLTQKVLGTRWAQLLDAFIVLGELFACCQRLILMGDFAVSIKHRLITHRFMPNRPLIVLLRAAVLIWPLIYTKKLQFLSKLSFGAVLCTLTGFAILTYTFIDTAVGEGLPLDDVVLANWSPDLMLALSIQQFAGQTGIIPLYREMRDRSLAKGKALVYISFSICGLLYVSFGTLGYLQYPGTQEANFFNLYEDKPGALYTALYISLASVVVVFPLNVIIGRLHLGYLVLGPKRAEERKWAVLFATLFFLGSLGIAVAIKNLGVVQGMAGGIVLSFVNLVVPGYALLKLLDKERKGGGSGVRKFENHAFEMREEGTKEAHESSPGRSQAGEGRRPNANEDRDAARSSPERSGSSDEASEGDEAQQNGQGADGRSERKAGKNGQGGHDQAPAGSPDDPPKPQSSSRLWLGKSAAYGLFAIALLQAGVATVGNVVSLCLVGWDDSSSTFSD